MRIELVPFQEHAGTQLLENLLDARQDFGRRARDQAVVLAAPTGSGKTVIATKLIESVIFGTDETDPDPATVFLWVTDQPQLNEQTRRKIVATSNVVGTADIVMIETGFDQEVLEAGFLYFLNTQKLGGNSLLIREGDERTWTLFQTITNTIERDDLHLYVVIDEAHRGALQTAAELHEATTIMQKFIHGSHGEMPPAPIVLGISATPERFDRLLENIDRTVRRTVVSPEQVQDSGLLKEVVHLLHPTAAQPSDFTLLREAAKDWRNYKGLWASYCAKENLEIVSPILIVQAEDGTAGVLTRTDLAAAIKSIQEEIGPLPAEAFAHAFQEGGSQDVDGMSVRYLQPADIEGDPDVQVVFFKSSLNTGWDCPRAEVMMSFRRARDATHIAQLVGRMVRAPLLRRIEDPDLLNGVSLYLPHYDQRELEHVVAYLTEPSEALAAVKLDDRPPVLLTRAPDTDDYLALLANLPSYVVPHLHRTSAISRLSKLADALAIDGLDAEAPEREKASLIEVLMAEREQALKDTSFQAAIAGDGTINVRHVVWRPGSEETTEHEPKPVVVSAENRDDLFRLAGRQLGEGLHIAYCRRRVESDPTAAEGAKLEVAALINRVGVQPRLERYSEERTEQLMQQHGAAIDALGEERRQVYRDIRRMARQPTLESLIFPASISAPRGDVARPRHLYVTAEQKAPIALNTWEQRTIDEELQHENRVAWLRNLDRRPWALCVPYRKGNTYKALYPDFLILRRTEDGTVKTDLLDPHRTSLEDAPEKARGLAEYAAEHGHRFGRICLIIVEDERVKWLDLQDPGTRQRVANVTTTQHLRELFSM